MTKKARQFRMMERKLLRLYSEWQETRRRDLEQQCLGLLGKILRLKPHFSLRREFETAF